MPALQSDRTLHGKSPRRKLNLSSLFTARRLGGTQNEQRNGRSDLSTIAPGRCAARMPGTGPSRRSSEPARKKAIVDKSQVEANRLQSPAFVFGVWASIGGDSPFKTRFLAGCRHVGSWRFWDRSSQAAAGQTKFQVALA